MKVVIALDGSPHANLALDMAAKLLASTHAEVSLLFVMPRHHVYAGEGAVRQEPSDGSEGRAAAIGLLDNAETRLKGMGVADIVHKEIAVGDPADMILDEAKVRCADLIVVGSRGLNAAQRFLLGSVSTKVVSHAHCPVLVVRPTD